MPHNFLVTGPPRSGKTTAIQRVQERLAKRGYRAGGIYCPERRVEGQRVGFDVVDAASGESRTLAAVDRTEGPRVGKYRVNVPGLATICESAFELAGVDYVVVDEIAPMELYSEAFVEGVRRALAAELPVLAAVHYRSTEGLIGEIERRADVERFEVTEETRDGLPGILEARIGECL